MSSIRSASSKTKKEMLDMEMIPDSIKSFSLPGVATTIMGLFL